MNFPDKFTEKATITYKLRNFIINYSLQNNCKNYLEIGFSKGYTLASLSNSFENLYGIDIDEKMKEYASSLFDRHAIKNIKLTLGDSRNITKGEYDIVLIDANHTYDFVKKDTINVHNNNTSEKYIIIYHDYGLVDAGVRKFCNEYYKDSFLLVGEEKGWNPLGGKINDYEAAYVLIDKKDKKFHKLF